MTHNFFLLKILAVIAIIGNAYVVFMHDEAIAILASLFGFTASFFVLWYITILERDD